MSLVFWASPVERPVVAFTCRATAFALARGGWALLAGCVLTSCAIRTQGGLPAVSCFMPICPAIIANGWAEVTIVYLTWVKPSIPNKALIAYRISIVHASKLKKKGGRAGRAAKVLRSCSENLNLIGGGEGIGYFSHVGVEEGLLHALGQDCIRPYGQGLLSPKGLGGPLCVYCVPVVGSLVERDNEVATGQLVYSQGAPTAVAVNCGNRVFGGALDVFGG